MRIKGPDTHPKSAQNFAHNAADLARAQNTGRFSAQVKPHQTAQRKVQFPNPVESAMDFAVQGNNESDSMLGHSVGRIARYPDNSDAQFLGGIQEGMGSAVYL